MDTTQPTQPWSVFRWWYGVLLAVGVLVNLVKPPHAGALIVPSTWPFYWITFGICVLLSGVLMAMGGRRNTALAVAATVFPSVLLMLFWVRLLET